jgi:hypothetical protein
VAAGVTVTVLMGVGVLVGVGVRVGVEVRVGVGVRVGLAVGEGDGEGPASGVGVGVRVLRIGGRVGTVEGPGRAGKVEEAGEIGLGANGFAATKTSWTAFVSPEIRLDAREWKVMICAEALMEDAKLPPFPWSSAEETLTLAMDGAPGSSKVPF